MTNEYRFNALDVAKRISQSEQTHLSRAADLYVESKQEYQKSHGIDMTLGWARPIDWDIVKTTQQKNKKIFEAMSDNEKISFLSYYRDKNASIRSIAHRLGYDQQKIGKICKKHNIKSKREKERIKRNVQKDVYFEYIKELGRADLL